MSVVIDIEMMQTAMEHRIGPLVGEFETPELKRIHDLWIEGGMKIREAQEALKQIATEAAQ